MKPTYSLIFLLLLVAVQARGQAKLHADTSYHGSITDIRTYRNKTLIKHVAIDTAGLLMYQSPLLSTQKIPVFRFLSGRAYYDTEKRDTIVFEKNIPQMNLWANFPGAGVLRINPYTYIIKEWKAQPGTQKGKMVIDVYENVFEDDSKKSKKVFHKVVLIDIR